VSKENLAQTMIKATDPEVIKEVREAKLRMASESRPL
jgi:hypothetical protein